LNSDLHVAWEGLLQREPLGLPMYGTFLAPKWALSTPHGNGPLKTHD